VLEHLPEPGGAGDAVAGGPVHDHVAVSFQQAHQRLDLLEQRVLLGARQQGHDAAFVEGVLAGPDLVDGSAQRSGQAPGIGVEGVEAGLDEREEVGPHPRNAGELGPVGDLVQGDPEPELTRREGVALLEREDVRPHVVDDVLVVGVLVLDDQQVVLAEDPGGHPSEEGAHLGAGHRTTHGGDSPRPEPLPEPLGEGAQEAAERRQVGPDPPGPVGDPDPRRPGEGTKPRLLGHQLLGLGGEGGEVGLERVVVVGLGQGLAPCDPNGDPLRHIPSDRVVGNGLVRHCLGYRAATTLMR
jgi:hypothetical protein